MSEAAHVSLAATSDLWWKNAIVYCLDVETYADSDDDGIGDFRGLTERIEHLANLGVTCLWLMPFYPSPDLDDGYDVTDYYDVDPRLGSLGDFVEFVRTAEDRGLKIIADLVVNHTSSQHPWFEAARTLRDSPYRDYYVWSDEPQEERPSDLIFPGAEDSIWDYDEEAGQYFLHRFYRQEPDLNVANPHVREEIRKAIGFWLELGLSGFRIDAVPYFIERRGIKGNFPDDPHGYLRELRAFVSRRRGDAVLLGEVNLEPKDLPRYFGNEEGDELHMLFDFIGNQALYLALVRGQAAPLERALESLPPVPATNQWARFVRNHDELTLDKLTEEEREEVFAAFAPQEEMRLFGRGIRRRLPTMLDGDRRRLELAYSLLFSLPGTPVLLYGEEIGMGDNLAADGRMSVRTPMQWTSEKPEHRIPHAAAPYGPEEVNVAAQEHDPESMLNWMTRVIRLRRQTPELGWGEWRMLEVREPAVFAHRCDWRGRTVVCAHNLADEACSLRLGVDALVDLYTGEAVGTEVELDAYGYRWFRATS